MNKISALVITYNEEHNIERFINDAYYANEIIIIDSYSTDKTVEIASKYPNVKIFKKEFKNFSDQKNFALKQATNDWVTFFDADEAISSKLCNEIIEKVNSEKNIDVYIAHHNFYFKNKRIYFSGQQNVRAPRLFRKSKCRYQNELMVHEKLIYKGESENLKNKIKHYTLVSEKSYLDKLNKYSYLRAEELFLKKLKPNLFHFYFKPFYRFFSYYIIRLGFLDGVEGFKISKLHAKSVQNRYKFLLDIYKKTETT